MYFMFYNIPQVIIPQHCMNPLEMFNYFENMLYQQNGELPELTQNGFLLLTRRSRASNHSNLSQEVDNFMQITSSIQITHNITILFKCP